VTAAKTAALRARLVRTCERQPWGEGAAVAVLLGFTPVAGVSAFTRHVTQDVAWDEVLAGPWSAGERLLVATAAALWRGTGTADIGQVARLDGRFYAAWQAMIAAARTGRVPEGW
jgi:hypothetical protein